MIALLFSKRMGASSLRIDRRRTAIELMEIFFVSLPCFRTQTRYMGLSSLSLRNSPLRLYEFSAISLSLRLRADVNTFLSCMTKNETHFGVGFRRADETDVRSRHDIFTLLILNK